MQITWDEPKRLANIEKHGLDFADVVLVDWANAVIETGHSNRFKAIGRFQDGTAVVIFATVGTEAVSIISFRPASPKEKEGAVMAVQDKALKKFKEGRGYTREDWDAVNSPELTDSELVGMKPAREVLPPGFFKAVEEGRRARGRPRVEAPKEAVTLRLDPALLMRFKAMGKDWRARMVEALEKAKV